MLVCLLLGTMLSYVLRYQPSQGDCVRSVIYCTCCMVMITAKHLHVTDIMVLLSPLPNKSASFVYSSELFYTFSL